MDKDLQAGDHVQWNTPQGPTQGTVVKRLTKATRVGNRGQRGTVVKAGEDEPRFEVQSKRTGRHAAHRPEALKKISG